MSTIELIRVYIQDAIKSLETQVLLAQGIVQLGSRVSSEDEGMMTQAFRELAANTDQLLLDSGLKTIDGSDPQGLDAVTAARRAIDNLTKLSTSASDDSIVAAGEPLEQIIQAVREIQIGFDTLGATSGLRPATKG